jgi:hypothetical protein
VSPQEEDDFVENTKSWLKPRRSSAGAKGMALTQDWKQAEYEEDLLKSEAWEKEEVRKLLVVANKSGRENMGAHELKVLLMALGVTKKPSQCDKHVEDIIQKAGEAGVVDFEAFWAWWKGFRA